MEQLSLGDIERSESENMYEAFVKEINNPEYSRFLSVELKKDGLISISAKTFLVARVKLTKKVMYLTVREKYYSYFEEYVSVNNIEVSQDKEAGNESWVRIPVSSLYDVLDLAKPICAVYMIVVADFCGERFGCCSRYEQCSDEGKCIHPDFLFSRACAYRENLEAGNIFYGKNRNVY